VQGSDGEVYVPLYRQFDGYPSGGHGQELAEWLEGAIVGNGISGGETRHFFNGVGDLAARLVTFFKEDASEIGGFYLVQPGSNDWGPDYIYTVKVVGGKGFDEEGTVSINITNGYSGDMVFEGSPEDVSTWILSGADEGDDDE